MMEDPELEKIKQKKLAEMIAQQQESIAQSQAQVIELNSSNFDSITSQGLVLVDFWAEWCGPCKMMHPIFERMAKKYRHIKFARVNVDQSQDISMKFGVQAIPTFIMFKDGKQVDKMMGAVGEPGIHMIAKKYQM
ncbi:MAG: thioredoxin [Nitrososphaeria archaeon]|nr:thioredoxin [Nitrososphaeria archaeon]NDB50886.1 thioredoxin [Nitrosopumilaceae archaeon]NDB88139.1 thioredoxin [Nitrososphaerota archaeon]NDB46423.1 thioredoxin [Nitrososphaeria archaeon]NDB89856.1 thioredoxin [Nitrososphaerota archaeon]